jgi:hypothetical protein
MCASNKLRPPIEAWAHSPLFQDRSAKPTRPYRHIWSALVIAHSPNAGGPPNAGFAGQTPARYVACWSTELAEEERDGVAH